ncbi:unnamed protein product [Albugo candida]|uniref:Uncharacterized protein n=1 Tax=Albugo candida TaxID=65357 RepID=A0A024G4B9_9STRA|nr:unnamed protein product [Albugo candida]|eukprot:CCI41506.1 unnamed protein product [Albugo candida]
MLFSCSNSIVLTSPPKHIIDVFFLFSFDIFIMSLPIAQVRILLFRFGIQNKLRSTFQVGLEVMACHTNNQIYAYYIPNIMSMIKLSSAKQIKFRINISCETFSSNQFR